MKGLQLIDFYGWSGTGEMVLRLLYVRVPTQPGAGTTI
jgi:hypothetical protein